MLRVTLIVLAFTALTACSSQQLNVVDNLTMSAKNDGVGMNPSRWFIGGHPLQTTYVSLNGQLAIKAGQICIASRFRSPFTLNCRESDLANDYIYSEDYKANGEDYKANGEDYKANGEDYKANGEDSLASLLTAVSDKNKKTEKFITTSQNYYSCLLQAQKDKKHNLLQHTDALEETAAESEATEKVANEATSVCSTTWEALINAKSDLAIARQTIEESLSKRNRLIYNWAEALKLEGGAIVQDDNNSASGNFSREASGYTLVDGVRIDRYQISCNSIQKLINEHKDEDRLKIVTMTLSTPSLYYNANQRQSLALAANLSFTPNELKTLENILDSDVQAEVNATLASSSAISSQGYLNQPDISRSRANQVPSTDDKTFTYYAVLTDLHTLDCD